MRDDKNSNNGGRHLRAVLLEVDGTTIVFFGMNGPWSEGTLLIGRLNPSSKLLDASDDAERTKS